MLVALMGVSGSGKTTVGTMLAEALGGAFLDADLVHPEANVDVMKHGRALTDADQAPWLAAVHARLRESFDRGQPLVVACSALNDAYRRFLTRGVPLVWVYLRGVDEPHDAIVADAALPPDTIVREILVKLRDKPDIRILEDLTALSRRAADTIVTLIDETVRRRGRCSLVLSGGSTPVPLHRLLATSYRARIPWSMVDVFWGDERYVPHDDALSNYRMARETLLDHVPCPADNIYPMPTHFADPDDAARDYQSTLEAYWNGGEPRLDVALLGMGPDGHTASLFPASSALHERLRLVVAAAAPAESPRRLTLTLPAFARSAHIHVLVSGAEKAGALSQVLSGADRDLYPAAGVRSVERPVVWWVDRDAASALTFE